MFLLRVVVILVTSLVYMTTDDGGEWRSFASCKTPGCCNILAILELGIWAFNAIL
jgi:hypothetical protein